MLSARARTVPAPEVANPKAWGTYRKISEMYLHPLHIFAPAGRAVPRRDLKPIEWPKKYVNANLKTK